MDCKRVCFAEVTRPRITGEKFLPGICLGQADLGKSVGAFLDCLNGCRRPNLELGLHHRYLLVDPRLYKNNRGKELSTKPSFLCSWQWLSCGQQL